MDDWYAYQTVKCIYATLDTCYSVWMTGMHTRQSNVFIRHLALVILYR